MIAPPSDAELAALRTRLEETLTQRSGGTVTVHALTPLSGGACQDNFRVELSFANGPLAQGAEGSPRRMVLRSDARQSLGGSIRRRDEFAVIGAAVQAGVRTPPAHYLCEDLLREGADAYLLEWRDGEAIGRRVLRNEDLAAAREALPDELSESLARVHSVVPSKHPDLRLDQFGDTLGEGAVASALGFLRRGLDQMKEPHPALELVLRWLRENPAPGSDEVTLVHGDFRTGNFLVAPKGLTAVLDWEFAHWGTPVEDLGWLCVRDWRFGRLDRPAGGFATRARMVHAYQRASGRTVDARAVHWWEVMGNARWAVGSVQQGERYLSGDESDLELIAIARRAVEMEYEALRLIERGPEVF